jgi:hypothetical protein
MKSQKQSMYVAIKHDISKGHLARIRVSQKAENINRDISLEKRCCKSHVKFHKEILRDNYAAKNNRIERGNLVGGSTKMTSQTTIFQLPSTI